MLAAIGLEVGPLLALLHTLALRLLIGVAALAALSAVLDSLYQRFEQHKQLRMSRRELQDEFKQTEGDPFLKARLKSLRLERARRRMMAEVPKATVVVTNPTHVAVALRYDATMAAPRLVAKGIGALAERIRASARCAWRSDRAQPAAGARAARRRRTRRRGATGAVPRGRRGDRLRAARQTALTYQGTSPAQARPLPQPFLHRALPTLGPTKRLRSR